MTVKRARPCWVRYATAAAPLPCSTSARFWLFIEKVRKNLRPPRKSARRANSRGAPSAASRILEPRRASRNPDKVYERGRLSLFVAHIDYFKFAHAPRRLHLDHVARVFADQRAGDGRADGNLAVLDIGLVVADDLVGHLVAARLRLQVHRGAKHATAVGIEQLGVDHLCIGELALDLGNASFDKALPLLGGVVLGVLGQIDVRARLRDRADHAVPVDRLQVLQLGAQQPCALDRKGVAHMRTILIELNQLLMQALQSVGNQTLYMAHAGAGRAGTCNSSVIRDAALERAV